MLILAAWVVGAALAQAAPAAQPDVSRPAASNSKEKPKAAPPEVSEVVVTAPKLVFEPDWSKKLNFDLHEIYSHSDTPYLRERPVDGCKPMAGGATNPAGKSGAAGGLVCSLRF